MALSQQAEAIFALGYHVVQPQNAQHARHVRGVLAGHNVTDIEQEQKAKSHFKGKVEQQQTTIFLLVMLIQPVLNVPSPPASPIPSPYHPSPPHLQAWSGTAASPPGRTCGMPSRQCGHLNGTPGRCPAYARQDCSMTTFRWPCSASLSFPPSTPLWRTPPTQSQVKCDLAASFLQPVLQDC